MKLFLAHTVVFVGSIWKSKSGWFLCIMSPGLSGATEVLLTVGVHLWSSLIFNPSFAENQPCMTPQGQWNSSLPIRWCLLDPYGRVRVVGSCLLCPLGCHCQWPQKFCWLLGSISDFHAISYAENQPCMTPQGQWNSSLPIYNGVCWILMEE
jgi:hypothetical protein